MQQLPLDLPHRPAHGRSAFLISACNAAAVAWIDRWPDWLAPGLVIHGPAGSGKTHLAAVWQARAAAELWPLARDAGDVHAAIVDHADRLFKTPESAEPALHVYNRLASRNRHVLFLARSPPARWSVPLADLRSRLVALPAVAIKPPDDAMLGGLFVKLFRDRQLQVPGDVIDYLMRRIERSCATVIAAVEAIDRASLAEKRAVTLPLVRHSLGFAQDDAEDPLENG